MAVDQKKPKTAAHATSKQARTHIGSKELTKNAAGSSLGSAIPEKWRDPLCILLIFVSLLLFFSKVLDSDHVLNAGDNIASEAFLPFLEASEAAGQNVPQWIPHIFGGMPAFAGLVVTGERTYDLVHEIFYLIRAIPRALFPNPEMMTQIFHYFLLGLGMYLLMRVTRNTSRLVALFAAFSAMFSTWILTYVMIGHNTKIFAVMTFPYILMAIEKLRQPKVPWTRLIFWSSVLAVFFHYALESTHMQMVFYIFLAVLIYFLYNGISELIRKQNVIPTIRTGVITLAMVGLAFAMSADRYMATLGYEPYSIRGKQPVTVLRGVDESATGQGQQQRPNNVTQGGGLSWDYATQYSFSPEEMITFIIPAYYGFGKLPYTGTMLNMGPEERVSTYWGQMTMTDAANYTGIVVFVFALIGIFALWKHDRLIPPLAILSLFALLLSFGGNFSLLFKPMFEYFPKFNSFRAPMMALVLMQLAFPIIAAITLEKLLESWKKNDGELMKKFSSYFKWATYAGAAFFLIALIGQGSIRSAVKEGFAGSGAADQIRAQYQGQAEALINDLSTVASDAAASDAMLCSLFVLLACGLVYAFTIGKLKSVLLMSVGVLLISVIDLWRVGTRPMEVTTRTSYASVFQPIPSYEAIKQDKSLYRVFDVTKPVSNIPVAHGLQLSGGYHAAKMRQFQDVVDVTGKMGGNAIVNPFMWDLLNVKYIVDNGQLGLQQAGFPMIHSDQSGLVFQNPKALPRAFFVRSYKVQDSLQTLYAMRDGTFDPRDVVFLTKDAADFASVSQDPLDSTERVDVVNYGNENVEYKTTSKAERILFISDTWYPNWTATVDGKAVPMHVANYAFRAIKVPAGSHTVKFTFDDPRYDTGKSLSLTANILALLGIALGIAGATVFPKKHKNPKVEVIPPPEEEAQKN